MYLKEGHHLHNNKYQLLNILGEGGFSLTYRGAWRTEIQGSLGAIPTLIPVCIKEYFFKDFCLRNETTGFVETNSETGKNIFEKNKEKIIKEARILSEVQHPNVVNVLEVFKQNNTVYIVMEFISGHSLKQEVEQKGVFQEDKLKKIIYKIGQALDYVHSKNILHLDIKPSNILMDRNKNPKLIDFGISKRYDLADDQQTSTTLQAASKGYASIEQYDSEGTQIFSPRPDIYSLGATMYYLLTGQVPTESILRSTKGLQAPRELNPAISQEMESVILKAMALNAEDRYENVMEVLFDMGYTEADKIDLNEISGTLAEKTELIKKINEQPYDADQDDATTIHLDTEKELEKKNDYLWVYLLLLAVIMIPIIILLLRKPFTDGENEAIKQADRNEWVFQNFYNKGMEEYNKNNLTEAKIQFQLALEQKDDPIVQTYIDKIDSINTLLISPEEMVSNNKQIQIGENETLIKEMEEKDEKKENKKEVSLLQETYDRLFKEAQTAYNQGDFQKALQLFKETVKQKNTDEGKDYIKLTEDALAKIEIEKKLNQYVKYRNFGNFVVARKRSDQKFGAIDERGDEIIPFRYLMAEPMGDNELFLRDDELYDLYSPSGELIKEAINDF